VVGVGVVDEYCVVCEDVGVGFVDSDVGAGFDADVGDGFAGGDGGFVAFAV